MAVTVLVIEARPFHRVHTFSQPVLSWSPDLYLTTRSYILQSLNHAVIHISPYRFQVSCTRTCLKLLRYKIVTI